MFCCGLSHFNVITLIDIDLTDLFHVVRTRSEIGKSRATLIRKPMTLRTAVRVEFRC
jgi:hypothetical protein